MWTRFDKLVQLSRDTNLWIIYSIAEERLSLVQNKSLQFCVFFLDRSNVLLHLRSVHCMNSSWILDLVQYSRNIH